MPAARPDSLRDLTVKMNRTLAEVVNIYARIPLEFDPGTESRYSSLGFATLGRIVEVISGKPYENFVEENIFTPLEMKDSFFFPPPDKYDRIASVYRLQGGKLRKFPIDIYRAGMKYAGPDFGMYSTAADLAAFYQMMLNGGALAGRRILSSRAVGEMISFQSPGPRFLELFCYGLGCQRVNPLHAALRLTSVRAHGHSGYFGTAGWIDP
jgi:CubicO group peptidase (beta-lactamase class C family)